MRLKLKSFGRSTVVDGCNLLWDYSSLTNDHISGKTKQKQSSGEMTKEKSKGKPGTNLYREANLCDLNAFLGRYTKSNSKYSM